MLSDPVCALAVHESRIWSSRGSAQTAVLQEWNLEGALVKSIDLEFLGALSAALWFLQPAGVFV